MQVNIFVSAVQQDGQPTMMLVLPHGPMAIVPEHLREVEWRYLATTASNDSLIGMPAAQVEATIVADGYVLTTPVAGPR